MNRTEKEPCHHVSVIGLLAPKYLMCYKSGNMILQFTTIARVSFMQDYIVILAEIGLANKCESQAERILVRISKQCSQKSISRGKAKKVLTFGAF
jgi:hypothetical protein